LVLALKILPSAGDYPILLSSYDRLRVFFLYRSQSDPTGMKLLSQKIELVLEQAEQGRRSDYRTRVMFCGA